MVSLHPFATIEGAQALVAALAAGAAPKLRELRLYRRGGGVGLRGGGGGGGHERGEACRKGGGIPLIFWASMPKKGEGNPKILLVALWLSLNSERRVVGPHAKTRRCYRPLHFEGKRFCYSMPRFVSLKDEPAWQKECFARGGGFFLGAKLVLAEPKAARTLRSARSNEFGALGETMLKQGLAVFRKDLKAGCGEWQYLND